MNDMDLHFSAFAFYYQQQFTKIIYDKIFKYVYKLFLFLGHGPGYAGWSSCHWIE